MAAQQNGKPGSVLHEPDFAQVGDCTACGLVPRTDIHLQAFQELARGEQTATALENSLDKIEKMMDEILAKAEEEEKAKQALLSAEMQPKSQPTSTESDTAKDSS